MIISGAVRFLVDVESLNGVESVGNISRHRTAQIVVPRGDHYELVYVPVVSGASIAHAYQCELAQLANSMGLPVTKESLNCEFIKFGTREFVEKYKDKISVPTKESEMRRFEVDVMLMDVVSDVGGFMFAPEKGETSSARIIPVRRSSRLYVSHMVPASDEEKVLAWLDSQFYVRYSPSTQQHNPYNVEVGSALYTFTFVLDTDGIAVPSNVGEINDELRKREEELLRQKQKRVEAAIKALYTVLTLQFGAKRARFLPIATLQSAVVTVTDFPFVPEPGVVPNYVRATIERAEKAKNILGGNVMGIYVINREGFDLSGLNPTVVSYPEDLIKSLLDLVKQGEQGGKG